MNWALNLFLGFLEFMHILAVQVFFKFAFYFYSNYLQSHLFFQILNYQGLKFEVTRISILNYELKNASHFNLIYDYIN